MKERVKLVGDKHLSLRRQSDLLSIHRSSLYYQPPGECRENLALMKHIDKLFLSDPTLGVLGMQDELRELGINYNVKRVGRLMRLMGIEPIYPRRNLSILGKIKYIHPYLLRGLKIKRSNQVWVIDITYVPMKKGFMYLTTIIDIYSRFVVGWQVSNSMEKETQTELLQSAIERYGKSEIINSDQGSQYTCAHWIDYLKTAGIKVSMDGKGRATDNAFIERFFGTIKRKHIYLYPAENGLALMWALPFIKRYNYQRRHQGIDRKKTIELYKLIA